MQSQICLLQAAKQKKSIEEQFMLHITGIKCFLVPFVVVVVKSRSPGAMQSKSIIILLCWYMTIN